LFFQELPFENELIKPKLDTYFIIKRKVVIELFLTVNFEP